MMRKRERENPCFICGHYHKLEEGEVCGVCGHRPQAGAAVRASPPPSAFPTEILPSSLYLGSYDNASRAELLKAQGITRILNAVPTCQNLYKNSFTYYSIKEDKMLPFDECIEFIEQSRKDNARVLVHCMSGQNRSPAIVIAYLMRHKGWRLSESYQWVKDRRPSINLSSAISQQLQDYEAEIFGSSASCVPAVSNQNAVPFGLEFPTVAPTPGPPIFSSVFAPSSTSNSFSFGSGATSLNSTNFIFGVNKQEQHVANDNVNNVDGTMDSL